MKIHTGAAKLANVPELELSEDEARDIAAALVEVNRHYPLPALNPKYVALGDLAVTLGAVYGPRVLAVANRGKAGKAVPAPVAAEPSGEGMAAVTAASQPTVGEWFARH